jgi:hypothetical protein
MQRSSTGWLCCVVNLPAEKRMQLGYASLLGIIGGNTSTAAAEGLDPNHFLDLITDELASLGRDGVSVKDAGLDNEVFTCYVKDLAFRSDYRGLQKHVRMKGEGLSVALACKGPLNARLATGVGLSFFLSTRERENTLPTNLGSHTFTSGAKAPRHTLTTMMFATELSLR